MGASRQSIETPMCLRSTRATGGASNTIQSGCSASKSFAKNRRVLAQGDRIQFRAPDRALGVANGDFATIKTIDAHRAVMRFDNGKEVSVGVRPSAPHRPRIRFHVALRARRDR